MQLIFYFSSIDLLLFHYMFRHYIANIRSDDVNHYIALLNFEDIIKYKI
jgi:succinate dehydrogenase flavin-adding protein (antitoxin of CptAB toxin-antitoxin module)